jgi:HD-GYP domain-containing protein (c-di-GMP phosphodiesterase class II)
VEIYDAYAFKHNIPLKEQEIFKDNLRIAAKFHDIGKVGISDLILKKPGRFTDCERDIMKGHTCLGAMLFYPIKSDLDQMSFDVALYHHERFDGGAAGYPGKCSFHEFYNKFENGTDDKMSAGMSYGQFFESNCINPSVNSFNVEIGVPLVVKQPLQGDEIPLSARIVAIADVFDALSHKRVYKNAWSLEDAFNEIKNNSGLQFDPELVDAFMSSKEQILAIFNAHGE